MLVGDLRTRIPEQTPRSIDLLPGLRLSRVLRQGGLPIAFVAAFALIPAMVFLFDRGTMLSIRQTRTAAGRIEQVRETQDCLRDDVRLYYAFSTADGVSFRGSDCVASQLYATLQPGDSVTVVHLERDPGTNAVVGGRIMRNAPPWPILALFPLLVLMFIGPMLWPMISQVLRDRKLFRTGIVLPGTLLFVSRRTHNSWPGWPGSSRSEVFVKVKLPTGNEREVRAFCDNDWLLSHLPPDAEVTVACHPSGSRAALLENYVR